jgi:FlaA1/EpsC-like NDP-sugar epimerase
MMSQTEAGQLCLLAAFLADHRDIYCPVLNPETDLISFAEIAEAFLEHHGYRAIRCTSAEEAKSLVGSASGVWPCYFTASDTTGEKPVEEFSRDEEFPDTETYREISILRARPANRDALKTFLAEIAEIRQSRNWEKAKITAVLRRAVPDLQHEELGRSLDEKM